MFILRYQSYSLCSCSSRTLTPNLRPPCNNTLQTQSAKRRSGVSKNLNMFLKQTNDFELKWVIIISSLFSTDIGQWHNASTSTKLLFVFIIFKDTMNTKTILIYPMSTFFHMPIIHIIYYKHCTKMEIRIYIPIYPIKKNKNLPLRLQSVDKTRVVVKLWER